MIAVCSTCIGNTCTKFDDKFDESYLHWMRLKDAVLFDAFCSKTIDGSQMRVSDCASMHAKALQTPTQGG